jgi:hypothetical protein
MRSPFLRCSVLPSTLVLAVCAFGNTASATGTVTAVKATENGEQHAY